MPRRSTNSVTTRHSTASTAPSRACTRSRGWTCDLVFNLSESFAGNDTADACIAAYLELLGKRFTGAGSHGLFYAQDKAVAKKILEFHGIHTPVFARLVSRAPGFLARP